MDGGAWWAAVHGVARSRTRLSDFTFTFHFHALEKEMATHSSGLAWRIPGMGEPGGLPSLGLHGVGHDWSDLAAAAAWLIHVELWQKTTKFCKEIILQLKKLYFHMSGVISLFFWLHLIWKSQGCPRSPLLLNMISEVLAAASRDDK